MLVPNVHWVIIEDANETSRLVENLLKRTGLTERSTQLNIKTPDNYKLKGKVRLKKSRLVDSTTFNAGSLFFISRIQIGVNRVALNNVTLRCHGLKTISEINRINIR